MKSTIKIITLIVFSIFVGSCDSVSKMFHKSGTYLLVEVEGKSSNEEVEKIIKALNQRVYNYSSGKVIREHELIKKPNQIVIDVNSTPESFKNWDKYKELLIGESRFELRTVVSPPNPNLAVYFIEQDARQTAAENQEVISFPEESQTPKFIIVEKKPILTGEDVKTAKAAPADEKGENYHIEFTLKKSGGEKMAAWSEKNINNYMASVYNGKAISVAYIQTKIEDLGKISGKFSKQEAEDLALNMSIGDFPYKLRLIEEKQYGNE